MLHSRSVTSRLQKIYEESYLTCSTAVYYERQGNEDEALRCWNAAVAQIRQKSSHSAIPQYETLNVTERTIYDSLRALEFQAKERVDLLDALKRSREQDALADPTSQTRLSSKASSSYNVASEYPTGTSWTARGGSSNDGWIGDGTIPAISYGELPRPEPPRSAPPVPPRHTLQTARMPPYDRDRERERGRDFKPDSSGDKAKRSSHSSSRKAGGSGSGNGSTAHQLAETRTEPESVEASSRSERTVLTKRTSKSPTKDKQHSLRPTLRSSQPGESSSSSRNSRSATPKATKASKERQGAGKAATLAWTALGLSSFGKGDSSRRASAADSPSSSNFPVPTLQPNNRKPQRDASPGSRGSLQWDSNSRRLVPQRAVPDPVAVSASRSSVELSSSTAAAADAQLPSDTTAISPKPLSLSLNAAASALGRSIQTPTDAGRASGSSSDRRPKATSTSSFNGVEKTGDYLSSRPKSTSNTRLTTPAGTPSHSISGSKVEIRRNVHSSVTMSSNGTMSPSPSVGGAGRTVPPAIPRKPVRSYEKMPSHTSQDTSKILVDMVPSDQLSSEDSEKLDENEQAEKEGEAAKAQIPWKKRKQMILKNLPPGVDGEAAKQILNEIVVQGDVVHWSDIAGLEPAKKALREAVVYPFLRPDLFMGLREPATGMLLFGPPGTGKTMLARAVATESRSTFFSISASSLTSKYLGESEKLVRALFALAKTLAPSIIFVDEIDSILSQRSGSGEHEATRRIKTEFLIQWSDLQRAAAGREDKEAEREKRNAGGGGGSSSDANANRVLVLAATNLPWAIDEAARRRFVRRQYIPLPEAETRAVQLRTLLGQQKHNLNENNIQRLVRLTDGFSGSDITALAKDAAMGPLRSLGDALLMTKMDEIRPMELADFESSLVNIRPSVSKSGLKEYEDWATKYGERGG